MRSDDFVAQAIRGVGLLLLVACVLWGIYILGTQVYFFLQTNIWHSIGTLQYFGNVLGWEWGMYPNSWLGLHALVDWVNAGVAIALAGCVAGLALANFEVK